MPFVVVQNFYFLNVYIDAFVTIHTVAFKKARATVQF